MPEQFTDISQIDKNLVIEENIDKDDIVFYDVRKAPVDFYGLYRPREEKAFIRMPLDDAAAVSDKVLNLAARTAGGRIRFRTDSPYIAIRMTKQARKSFMAHMTHIGCSGFDCYAYEDGEYKYIKPFIPAVKMLPGFESLIEVGEKKMRDITINFPLYDRVENLWLGLQEGAVLEHGGKYVNEKPVLFYGSSITEGGCASRPGNCYTAMVCRWLNCDHVNLGFSGSAKGEKEIADYIAKQDMSVFVMDYDYNSATEDLQATHWNLYETVRKAQPNLPIIMASKCDLRYQPEKQDEVFYRRQLIMENYQRGLDAGDKHLQFLDGQTVYAPFGGMDCTVDGAHPNDLGFYAMAKAFLPYIERALQENY